MTPDNSDPQLDRELRRVPLPKGFLHRLRAAADDAVLDEALRSPPLPDEEVQRVADGVLEMLWREGAAETPLPARLLPRLHIIPQQRPRRALRRLATAAVWTLFASALHLLALTGILATAGGYRPAQPPLAVLDMGPLDLQAQPSTPQAVQFTPSTAPTARVVRASAAVSRVPVRLAQFDLSPSPGPAGSVWRDLQGFDLWSEVEVHAPPARAALVRRGLHWPQSWAHARWMALPSAWTRPMRPETAAGTHHVQVPVSVQTASFDEAWQQLVGGQAVRVARVRSEDFVAALGTPSSVDGQPMQPVVALAPHPFGSREQYVMQVSISPGPAGSASQVALDLVFNPAAVAAYRIVGYGSAGPSQVIRALRGDDLGPGQAATVLVELWLQSDGEQPLAVVTAQWRELRGGAERTSEPATISLRQAAGAFSAAPPSLYLATLAAETAALLDDEPVFTPGSSGDFIAQPRALRAAELLQAARQAPPAVTRQPQHARLMQMLERL